MLPITGGTYLGLCDICDLIDFETMENVGTNKKARMHDKRHLAIQEMHCERLHFQGGHDRNTMI